MTAPRDSRDLDEREVDLARWRRAVVAYWWLPVAGLVVGAIIGVLFSFGGGTDYKASALISLGQPFSPGGSLVTGYGTNPRAIQQIVSGAAYQEQAANKADMRPDALRGHVSVATVGTATGSAATKGTPLISLTVTGAHAANTADAANALASIVVDKTTALYVGIKITTFRRTLQVVDDELGSVNKKLAAAGRALVAAKHLPALQQLVVVAEEDNAEARLGSLISQQEALQQQLAFADQVESAKIVEPARAMKAAAHSRRASLLIGALIGLIIGAIVAIVVDGRRAPVAA